MIEEFSGFFLNIKAFCEDQDLLRPGSKILLAVSGGVDSVVLLHFAAWLSQRYPLELAVAHVNHRLRPEADRDQEFVAELAKAYGLDFYSKSFPVADLAHARGAGIEEAGRYVRREYWRELQKGYAFDQVATGHHLDDLAETILLNIGRGTGLAGLTSLRANQPPYARPLLHCSREEIQAFAVQHSLAWVEDESNKELTYLRNKIRHQLLPCWRELLSCSPQEKLADLAENLDDDRLFLDDMAAKVYQEIKDKDKVPAAYFLAQPRSIRFRLMRLWLDFPDLSRKHFQAIEALLHNPHGNKQINLPGGLRLAKRRNIISCYRL